MTLENYINKSSCNLNFCPYGEDIDCKDCNTKMLEEYKEKVKADAIDEYFSKAEDMLYSNLYEHDELSMNDVIMVLGTLAEQLKESDGSGK